MKKLIALLVAVALLVSASATVFALSSSPTSTNKSGLNVDSDSKSYSYYCELSATTSSASTRMTYGRNSTSINSTVKATIAYNDTYIFSSNTGAGNSSIKVTTYNRAYMNSLLVTGTIIGANGLFKIMTKQVASLSVS